MTLYEARLLLKSPAIVTVRKTERGYVKPSSFIPGSTLRGAILTALYRAGSMKEQDLEAEARSPKLLTSAAFPVAEGRRTLPATPFIASCKLCGATLDLTRNAVEALQAGRDPEFPLLCPKDGGPLESLYSRPVYARDGRLRPFRLKTFRATSVGISKERGSAVKGLLFDYEAITDGAEFWAWIVSPNDMQMPSRLEVAVGRGQSRGFGWGELNLRPVSQMPNLQKKVFVALSPFTPWKEIAWESNNLKVSKILGRKSKVQLGWDMVKKGLRPSVKLSKPGSMVVAELLHGEPPAFIAGLPVQVNESWVVGLNSLLTVDEYYRLMEVTG
ncbi:MAG: hypothetical protein NZ954_08530 [Thermofilaceae archaeon]|nr:hypothetical protein [Thermofilaceae archaeon]MDW8004927.1 hypothetical protein [Thermofilaceae archaeon]